MRKVTRTQSDTATWATDSTIRTAIERVGLLTRIVALVEVTPSATLAVTNQPDGLWRVIQNLRIEGSTIYCNLPADDGCQGGSILHYRSMLDGAGPGHEQGAITAPSAAYVPIAFPIHFGARPTDAYGRDNPFDLSAFIPAEHEGQLNADWITAGNDVMDDAVTISSAVMRFILHRVLGTEAELAAEMAQQGIALPPGAKGMVPSWSATVHANAGATSDFDAEQIDVPVGAWLKRLIMLNQDATATRTLRAGDQVTEYAVRIPETNEDLIRTHAELSLTHLPYGSNLVADGGQLDAATGLAVGEDFNNCAPKGITVIDFRSYMSSGVGREYGWDLRGQGVGSIKLGLLISNRAAGDDTLCLFERYQAYVGPLAK